MNRALPVVSPLLAAALLALAAPELRAAGCPPAEPDCNGKNLEGHGSGTTNPWSLPSGSGSGGTSYDKSGGGTGGTGSGPLGGAFGTASGILGGALGGGGYNGQGGAQPGTSAMFGTNAQQNTPTGVSPQEYCAENPAMCNPATGNQNSNTSGSSDKQSGGVSGQAVGANANWSQADIAKLQGPVTQGGEAEPAAAAAPRPPMPPPNAVAQVSQPDLLGKTVASLGGAPALQTPQQQAMDFIHSAANKLKLGDNAGALRDALQAIQLDPMNPAGYARAAEAYNHMGQWADAERMARQAIEKDPNNAQAWKNLAWALLKQGKYKEAMEAAMMAARLKPDMAEAWAIAAYAAERLNLLSARNANLQKAAALDPRFQEKLSDALKGGLAYRDEDSDSLFGDMQGKAGGAGLPLAAGGAAGALSLAGLGFWLWRRRRRAAQAAAATVVQLEPEAPVARAPQLVASSGGLVVGKYELGSLIGRGGMGEVYIAKDLSLGRPVAIKKMTDGFSELGAQARALFLKEARTVAQLHHPAIVDIYEILEHDTGLYLVFEYVKGKTAQQALAEAGRLPLSAALSIVKPVCEALDFAHSRALVHRDLKPGNIMLTEQGHVKLMDFGIARSLGDAVQTSFGLKTAVPAGALSAARTATVVGTPSYMAPESELGVVCKEGDVYSLGVTLYEMLTGRLPFSVDKMAEDKASLRFHKASTLAAGLPASIDALIEDALQPLVERRLKTPGEFLGRLAAAAGG